MNENENQSKNYELKDERVYPHPAIAVLSIIKLWIVTGGLLAAIFFGRPHLPEPFWGPLSILAGLLLLGSLLFAAHSLLHYSNTFLAIHESSLIYKKGWIPSTTDTIFWVNIKDINTKASISESLIGTGSIILTVAIRTEIYLVSIGYLPNHEQIASKIRDHLGNLNKNANQVTYT